MSRPPWASREDGILMPSLRPERASGIADHELCWVRADLAVRIADFDDPRLQPYVACVANLWDSLGASARAHRKEIELGLHLHRMAVRLHTATFWQRLRYAVTGDPACLG